MTRLSRRTLLASAAALAAPGIARAQEVVLDFPSWQAQEAGFSDWWREAIAAFQQQNQNVRVNLFQIPFPQYVNQLTTRFAGNNPPDIVHLPARNVAQFAAQDWLLPIDDVLATTDVPRLWTPLQEEMKWEGSTRGLLLMGYGGILYYNERLLNEAGLQVPTTPEAWQAGIERITRRDQGIFGLCTPTIEHPALLVDAASWVMGQGHDWLAGGRYNFTAAPVVAALEGYRRACRFAPPGQTSEATRTIFLDGKGGFLRDGPWVIASLRQAPEAVRPHLKTARLPFQHVAGGTSNSLHIATRTTGRKRELVSNFIRLVTTAPLQERYTVLTGSPAPRRGALSDAQAAQLPHLRLVNAAAEEARNLFPVVNAVRENYNEFARAIAQACMRMISSNDPTDRILGDLQRTLERQIPLR